MSASARSAVIAAMGAALIATGCSSASIAHDIRAKAGVEVDFVNANVGDVTFLDSPVAKSVKLRGCEVHTCSPSPESPSGGVLGWTETRTLPHTYRLSLRGSPLRCPAAIDKPAGWTGSYAVVYQITASGRCYIIQRSPLD